MIGKGKDLTVMQSCVRDAWTAGASGTARQISSAAAAGPEHG
jgi:hypothetical protein